MTKRTKYLLITGIALLLVAFSIKRVHLSEKASMIVGLVEVISAIALGVAFGLAGRAEEK